MKIRLIRIIECILLVYILYLKAWTLLPYWSAMMVSLEILNRKNRYLNQSNFTAYNWFFVGYLVLVVVDRTRHWRIGEAVEWAFNSLMHVLFALIVCFKISQYLMAFDVKIKNRTLFIALAFNILGVVNEGMQNIMCSRPLFSLIADSQKDLVMNVVGTLVFVFMQKYFDSKTVCESQ